MESNPDAGSLARPCKKCQTNEATLTIRAAAVCKDCFLRYISTKCAKQVGILAREVRPLEGTGARKFLVGLSLGVSSSVLLDLLHENVLRAIAKSQRTPFEVIAVHVDADFSADVGAESSRVAEILGRYREKYPHFIFRSVTLASAIGLRTIDWATLPSLDKEKGPAEQIRILFERLPSTTSKADVLRIFTRHILISEALGDSCQALLLGYSTTALAELTLAETAKGRGFSLPWQVHDGHVPILSYREPDRDSQNSPPRGGTIASILMYSPLRELLRKELVTYSTLISPPLTDILPEDLGRASTVVSHKDHSIEEVMSRYFEEVEQNFPSVVANVAKTTGKLDRMEASERCGLCNMPLDEQGDERWRGEIGDDDGVAGTVWHQPLCYGCKRSVGG